MKLHELAAPNATQQISQVFESYFGSKLSFDQLNRRQANHMLNRVQGILGEHRQTSARHNSEQNPDYLKLVMMEQALAARVKEAADTVSGAIALLPLLVRPRQALLLLQLIPSSKWLKTN